MTRSRDVSKGATRNEFIYTATATQTTFSGNDDSSNSLSYTVGQIDVFLNGSRLAPADFTATNGTSVVLDSGAVANDVVQINAFGTFSVSDVVVARAEFDYTATAGQTTFTGSDNDSQTMAYTAGRIDVYLNGSRLNVTDDYTATNGTSVVLAAGAQAGDSLVVVAHGTVNLASNILSGDLDLAGNELILDADNDTTITADTDDQIDIKIAGADDFQFTANDFTALSGSVISTDTINETTSGSGVTIDSVICKDGTIDVQGNNDAIILDADGDTTISANTDDKIDFEIGGTNHIQFDDNGRILQGHTQSANIGGAECKLQIQGTSTETSSISLKCNTNGTTAPTLRFAKSRGTSVNSETVVQDGDELGVIVFAGADGTDSQTQGAVIIASVDGSPGGNDLPTCLRFNTTADGAASTTERMRISQGGEVQFAKTDSGFNTAGHEVTSDNVAGKVNITRDNGAMIHLNILNADGAMQRFYRDGSIKGDISVSGGTVSYNAFTGSHWTRLSDNSKPTILAGTVLESIDTMCDWYEAEFTFGEGEDAHIERERCAKPDGVNVGGTFTYSYKGKDYTATLRLEDNNKHTMCKVSDTEDSACVYGVFGSWKNELTNVNDMYVQSIGTTVVRVASGVTVSKGVLLSSKGDGTAKLQGDDNIKTKTIGKVLSNIKQETYDDGSFTVPCALYCG